MGYVIYSWYSWELCLKEWTVNTPEQNHFNHDTMGKCNFPLFSLCEDTPGVLYPSLALQNKRETGKQGEASERLLKLLGTGEHDMLREAEVTAFD